MTKRRTDKHLMRFSPSFLDFEKSEIIKSIRWCREKRWLFRIVLALCALTAISWAIHMLWLLPKRQADTQYPNITDIERAKIIEESRKTLISGIGTFATIAGAIVLVANLKESKDRLAYDTGKSAREFEIAESRLLSERFCKAVELLGEDSNESVQLGGIYSLEQIAKDSPGYYWTVMEVLTAFIRRQSPLLGDERYMVHPEISFIIQSALTSVCRSNIKANDDPVLINLGQINLSFANFATVNGESDFSHAFFAKSNLRSATLSGLDLSFSSFSGAFLNSANLAKSNLKGANFQLANLSHADLSYSNLDGAIFDGAILHGTIFKGVTNYSGANWVGVKRFEEAIALPKDLIQQLKSAEM